MLLYTRPPIVLVVFNTIQYYFVPAAYRQHKQTGFYYVLFFFFSKTRAHSKKNQDVNRIVWLRPLCFVRVGYERVTPVASRNPYPPSPVRPQPCKTTSRPPSCRPNVATSSWRTALRYLRATAVHSPTFSRPSVSTRTCGWPSRRNRRRNRRRYRSAGTSAPTRAARRPCRRPDPPITNSRSRGNRVRHRRLSPGDRVWSSGPTRKAVSGRRRRPVRRPTKTNRPARSGGKRKSSLPTTEDCHSLRSVPLLLT